MITPKGLYAMVQQYKEAQLLMAAIRLNLFTYLGESKTAQEISKETGYNERNLEFFLNALATIELLEKEHNRYKNTPMSEHFLSKESAVYLGESLLFREQATSLERVEERVKYGPDQDIQTHNRGVDVYNFYEWARVAIPEMYAVRVQSLLTDLKQLFQTNQAIRVLDLGGGSGVLCMEVVRAYNGSKGVIFEYPSVADLPRKLVVEREMADVISVVAGDFNVDDIGSEYDLIIASGIIDFAKDTLDHTVNKIYDALQPTGYLYLVSQNISDDYLSPKEAIVGWLSSHLDGLDILLRKSTVNDALDRVGFDVIQNDVIGGAMSNLRGTFYRKK